MLETSKDLLYIVIAFCVLWLTIFICWVIYYFAMILKRIHSLMEMVTKTLEAVRNFFDHAKEKVNNLGATISTAVELGKKMVDYVQEKKSKKAGTKKSAE